jgi:hypothetical protein
MVALSFSLKFEQKMCNKYKIATTVHVSIQNPPASSTHLTRRHLPQPQSCLKHRHTLSLTRCTLNRSRPPPYPFTYNFQQPRIHRQASSEASEKLEIIQRRLAWPPRRDDMRRPRRCPTFSQDTMRARHLMLCVMLSARWPTCSRLIDNYGIRERCSYFFEAQKLPCRKLGEYCSLAAS